MLRTVRSRFASRTASRRCSCPTTGTANKRDVTDDIKAFYEANPFPNYDDFDSAASLLDKARTGLFARLLDEQIPFGARVIECGCGTGQLTNFLSIANRTVVGADLCLNSLKMATAFKDQNELDRAHFLQMNLFRPCFKPATFDLVISNGVLHHTADPLLGLQVDRTPGEAGWLLAGRPVPPVRTAGDRHPAMGVQRDQRSVHVPRPPRRRLASQRRQATFVVHGPVQEPARIEAHRGGNRLAGWTTSASSSCMRFRRPCRFAELQRDERLFRPERIGSLVERLLVNLGLMVTGHREGGFFITIARRPVAEDARPTRPTSEQRIDKRRRAAAANHNQPSEQQQHQDNRRQPPLLGFPHEPPQLTEQAGRAGFRELTQILLSIVVVRRYQRPSSLELR